MNGGLIPNLDTGSIPVSSVTWTSSDATVASVDGDGIVTGTAPGRAKVQAAAEGKTASIEFTVE